MPWSTGTRGWLRANPAPRREYKNGCEGLDQKRKEVTCRLWDDVGLDQHGVSHSSDGNVGWWRRLTEYQVEVSAGGYPTRTPPQCCPLTKMGTDKSCMTSPVSRL